MKKAIIFWVFILIIGALILGLLYFKYEKPVSEEEVVYKNLNIYAIEYDGKKIETQADIFLEGVFSNSINTSNFGAVLYKIPTNRTFAIYNSNIGDQKYYISKVTGDSYSVINNRVELELVKPGRIEVESVTLTKSNITITLGKLGEYRNMHFCVKYSPNMIFASSLQGFQRIDENPKRFLSYDKCFEVTEGYNSTIILGYKTFGELKTRENMILAVYDGDYYNNKFLDGGEEDIFSEDLIQEININNI